MTSSFSIRNINVILYFRILVASNASISVNRSTLTHFIVFTVIRVTCHPYQCQCISVDDQIAYTIRSPFYGIYYHILVATFLPRTDRNGNKNMCQSHSYQVNKASNRQILEKSRQNHQYFMSKINKFYIIFGKKLSKV